jgi:hypothetical protein
MVQTSEALDLRSEIVMALVNIAGHSYNKAEWASYLLDMYGKGLEKKDRALYLTLVTIKNHEKCVAKISEKYIEMDDESLRIFTTHLGGFFNTMRRANPEQKALFFEKLDAMQVEFSEAVNGKEGIII